MATKTDMKAIIFAGGVGTRMWPLSRKSSPKQFEPIIDGKSTLQLAVERLLPEFNEKNIYISTGEQYEKIIEKQLPNIPPKNIIGEPEMRDVGPAVGYLMSILELDDPDTPVALLWSDHLVENVDKFKQALITGGEYLKEQSDRFVFVGQKPRFANQNLGWIEYADTIEQVNGISIHKFSSWHYRPDLQTAKTYFKSGHHAWNTGYLVATPSFVMQQFKMYTPSLYKKLKIIQNSYTSDDHASVLKEIYPTLEKIHFDNAILEQVPNDKAVVLSVDLDWSDIGTWEALKEALQDAPADNIQHGKTFPHDTTNSVIYNYTDQLVTTVDLDDMVVVVTEDAVLVTRSKSIPKIKKMLKQFEGTELEPYT